MSLLCARFEANARVDCLSAGWVLEFFVAAVMEVGVRGDVELFPNLATLSRGARRVTHHRLSLVLPTPFVDYPTSSVVPCTSYLAGKSGERAVWPHSSCPPLFAVPRSCALSTLLVFDGGWHFRRPWLRCTKFRVYLVPGLYCVLSSLASVLAPPLAAPIVTLYFD